MTSHIAQQVIIIYILFNISGSKGNQAMKFGQLIEYRGRKFSSKLIQKESQGDELQTCFCFLKKLCIN